MAKVISLNSGVPAPMEWEGKSVLSSMHRHPVPGPLIVHLDRIDENTYGNSAAHGVEHSVVYAYGNTSALAFMKQLGGGQYVPGATGENVTLDELKEDEVSVGDVFQLGEVQIQATAPRIPCGKVNLRMKNAQAQRAMQACGKSGVYFRVLKPGKISMGAELKLLRASPHRLLISDMYRKIVSGEEFTPDEMRAGLATGALPKKMAEKWDALLNGTKV